MNSEELTSLLDYAVRMRRMSQKMAAAPNPSAMEVSNKNDPARLHTATDAVRLILTRFQLHRVAVQFTWNMRRVADRIRSAKIIQRAFRLYLHQRNMVVLRHVQHWKVVEKEQQGGSATHRRLSADERLARFNSPRCSTVARRLTPPLPHPHATTSHLAKSARENLTDTVLLWDLFYGRRITDYSKFVITVRLLQDAQALYRMQLRFAHPTDQFVKPPLRMPREEFFLVPRSSKGDWLGLINSEMHVTTRILPEIRKVLVTTDAILRYIKLHNNNNVSASMVTGKAPVEIRNTDASSRHFRLLCVANCPIDHFSMRPRRRSVMGDNKRGAHSLAISIGSVAEGLARSESSGSESIVPAPSQASPLPLTTHPDRRRSSQIPSGPATKPPLHPDPISQPPPPPHAQLLLRRSTPSSISRLRIPLVDSSHSTPSTNSNRSVEGASQAIISTPSPANQHTNRRLLQPLPLAKKVSPRISSPPRTVPRGGGPHHQFGPFRAESEAVTSASKSDRHPSLT